MEDKMLPYSKDEIDEIERDFKSEKDFKYFPNDLSLFQICDKIFPIAKGIEDFEKSLRLSPIPERLIQEHLDSIQKRFQTLKSKPPAIKRLSFFHFYFRGWGKRTMGEYAEFREENLHTEAYKNKMRGRDKSSDSLKSDFYWIRTYPSEKLKKHISQIIDLNRAGTFSVPYTANSVDFEELVEREYFNRLCAGVNSAIFEGYLLDLKKRYDSGAIQKIENEPMPEFEFKGPTQKIAWLFELGIIDAVVERCKINETTDPSLCSINFTRASNILSSVTDLDAGTVKQAIRALYTDGDDYSKNNPLKNPENRMFVDNMKAKFCLSQ